MLKIKLARFGKKKHPHYRIVVNEARDRRDGKSVDTIGHYAPTEMPKVLQIDMVKLEDWIKKGAQPTDTVSALVSRFKSGNPFPEKKPSLSKKAKAKMAAEKEAAQAAAAAPAQEAAAPAPEAPAAETAPAEAPATETSTEAPAA